MCSVVKQTLIKESCFKLKEMQIAKVLLLLFAFAVTSGVSTKVIYEYRGSEENALHHGGILVVHDEKKVCQGERTSDKDGRCRKLVQF